MIRKLKNTYDYFRYWFFEKFGERTSIKCYLGHGNFDELNGWIFRGRFVPCSLKEEKEFYETTLRSHSPIV